MHWANHTDACRSNEMACAAFLGHIDIAKLVRLPLEGNRSGAWRVDRSRWGSKADYLNRTVGAALNHCTAETICAEPRDLGELLVLALKQCVLKGAYFYNFSKIKSFFVFAYCDIQHFNIFRAETYAPMRLRPSIASRSSTPSSKLKLPAIASRATEALCLKQSVDVSLPLAPFETPAAPAILARSGKLPLKTFPATLPLALPTLANEKPAWAVVRDKQQELELDNGKQDPRSCPFLRRLGLR